MTADPIDRLPHNVAQALSTPKTTRRIVIVQTDPEPTPAAKTDPTRDYTQDLTPELRACYPSSGPIAAYLDWMHKTTHAPPIFHLGSILPILAEEAVRRGYQYPDLRLTIWTLLIGPTAAGKSYCYRQARRFAAAWWKDMCGQFYEDPFISAEGSVPGVLEVLSQRFDEQMGTTHGILVLDEFTRILQQELQSQALCMLFDGDDYVRNLRKLQSAKAKGERVNESIRQPTVSAVFAAPISLLEHVGKREHLEGGLMTRILFFEGHVPSHRMMLFPIARPKEAAACSEEWREWFRTLDGMAVVNKQQILVLTPAARAPLQALFDEYKEYLDHGDTHITGIMTRLMEYVRKVAGIYALSQGRTEVLVADVEQAVALSRQCHKAIELIGQTIGVNEVVRLQWKIESFVREHRGNGVPRTTLYRHFNISKDELERALAGLIDSGEIIRETLRPDPPKAGRHPEYLFAKDFAPTIVESGN